MSSTGNPYEAPHETSMPTFEGLLVWMGAVAGIATGVFLGALAYGLLRAILLRDYGVIL